MSEALKMPPLASVLKSKEVEDPVNVYVERPLAYAFAWSIFRTRITPNMVTVFAIIAGITAGVMFVWGTSAAMVVGGLMMFASAIFDGADGILARAKNQQSQFGRALDGAGDGIVAVVTVFTAFYHIWVTTGDPLYLWLMVPTIISANVHLIAYDYFKESYLRQTRLESGGEGADPKAVAKLVEPAREKGILTYLAVRLVLLPYVQTQQKIIHLIDRQAQREGVAFKKSQRTVDIYRRHNQSPMQVWALISLAPHTYIMAFCAAFDQLHVYLWIRLVLMNAVFIVAILWQRRATERTLDNFEALGAIQTRPDTQPLVAHAA